MEKINNFKGLLVYIDSDTKYTDEQIKNITAKAPDILDYVILDIYSPKPTPSEVLKVAKDIYNYRQNIRIWIGTPAYSSGIRVSANDMINNLNDIKNTFMNDSKGKTIWNNCVKGVYFNMETIYGDMDYDISFDKNNCVELNIAKDVSNHVHNDMNLNLLWIPYYNDGSEKIVKSMAYMVARTNVFDIVIIQPGYYFDYSIQNLDAVSYSVQENNICYRNGNPIFSRIYDTATVGFEMEVDNDVKSYKRDRYEQYVNKFSTLKDYPMCYYANTIANIQKNYILIEDFYGVYGDADGDGTLTANDAAIVLQYVLDGSIPERITYMCDVNGDNIITAEDSSLIFKKVIDDGFIFPIVDAAFGS